MIQAVNNFVFIQRDETETQAGRYVLPDQSQEKPQAGWGEQPKTDNNDK